MRMIYTFTQEGESEEKENNISIRLHKYVHCMKPWTECQKSEISLLYFPSTLGDHHSLHHPICFGQMRSRHANRKLPALHRGGIPRVKRSQERASQRFKTSPSWMKYFDKECKKLVDQF